jgi:quinol monooxygenase YgiN
MTVIIAGIMDLADPSQMQEMLLSARPHIEGALTEEGCIEYAWTEDHLTPGRLYIYEEWASSEALEAHLQSHWYRDMGGHLAQYPRKDSQRVIKKYRVDLEEPVYDDTGVARGHFFTAS